MRGNKSQLLCITPSHTVDNVAVDNVAVISMDTACTLLLHILHD